MLGKVIWYFVILGKNKLSTIINNLFNTNTFLKMVSHPFLKVLPTWISYYYRTEKMNYKRLHHLHFNGHFSHVLSLTNTILINNTFAI